jgi:hypothetical protein
MSPKHLIVAAALALAACGPKTGDEQAPAQTQSGGASMGSQVIEISRNDSLGQLNITQGGQPFTSYCYWKTLKKPVFYPLRTDDGRVVSRSFPFKMVPGERSDHPHQFSSWFTYGNVNGIDFWGNSDAVDQTKGRFGTIVNRSVDNIRSFADSASVDLTMDWLGPDGGKVLAEKDRVYFRSAPGIRIIDRLITLTAQDKPVLFADTKEGMFGIRVVSSLEEPSTEPGEYVDARGEKTTVAKTDSAVADGQYVTSEGKVGEKEVWGTAAKWCILRGTVEGKPATLAIFDHPGNVGFPTHWHARGYGLFSVNPLGIKDFTSGKDSLNFSLQPGQSGKFFYRILIASSRLEPAQAESLYQAWLQEVSE